jgi:hypothetical protein
MQCMKISTKIFVLDGELLDIVRDDVIGLACTSAASPSAFARRASFTSFTPFACVRHTHGQF